MDGLNGRHGYLVRLALFVAWVVRGCWRSFESETVEGGLGRSGRDGPGSKAMPGPAKEQGARRRTQVLAATERHSDLATCEAFKTLDN